MDRILAKTISFEDIRRLVQKRLALPEHWETHTARLETRAVGKKVWKLGWKTRDQDRDLYY